jgi:site-specific recombinase XerD
MSITIHESEKHQSFLSFWQPIKITVMNGVSNLTATSYGPSIDDFLNWWFESGESNPIVATTAYRHYLAEERGFKPATANKKLSAIRKLFETAAVFGIGKENWPLSFEVSTAIKSIKNIPQHGTTHGTRLNKEQLEALCYAPSGETILGKRDRTVLALLVGCGLRRSEVTNLTWGHLRRDGKVWEIVDLKGKHGRIRTVPVPQWVYDLVLEYSPDKGRDSERIVVSYDRHGNPRGKITSQSIYRIVVDYSEKLGFGVAPHDLRRSNARYLRDEGVEIENIQHELGHSSSAVTDRYIGREGDSEKVAEAWEGFGSGNRHQYHDLRSMRKGDDDDK